MSAWLRFINFIATCNYYACQIGPLFRLCTGQVWYYFAMNEHGISLVSFLYAAVSQILLKIVQLVNVVY